MQFHTKPNNKTQVLYLRPTSMTARPKTTTDSFRQISDANPYALNAYSNMFTSGETADTLIEKVKKIPTDCHEQNHS